MQAKLCKPRWNIWGVFVCTHANTINLHSPKFKEGILVADVMWQLSYVECSMCELNSSLVNYEGVFGRKFLSVTQKALKYEFEMYCNGDHTAYRNMNYDQRRNTEHYKNKWDSGCETGITHITFEMIVFKVYHWLLLLLKSGHFRLNLTIRMVEFPLPDPST